MEQKLVCDLTDRKKEIADVIAQYVAENHKDEEEEEEEADDGDSNSSGSESDDNPPPSKTQAKKRAAAPAAKKSAPKPKKKRTRSTSSDSGAGSDATPSKKKATAAVGKGKGKGNIFTRPFKLSPELASLMGAESLARHEVVKKVWALIKERNLYDPNNKQFAICDADLMTVIGTKRFRTFGMLKYLKKHFVE